MNITKERIADPARSYRFLQLDLAAFGGQRHQHAGGAGPEIPALVEAGHGSIRAGAGRLILAQAIAGAIGQAHRHPDETYPASLYGTGEPTGPSDGGVHKESQWMDPDRRRRLLAASVLGRAALAHRPRHG